nr:MAG TPA: hypothetical protein [Caudoviricetes sp.]
MPSFSVVLGFTHYGLTVPDLRVAKTFAPAEVSRFIQLSLCCLVLLYV